MWKMVKILSLVLVVSLLIPAVSFAGGRDYYGPSPNYYRNSGPDPSLFIIAAIVVGAVVGGFQNAPAYWGDPYYRKNLRSGYSRYERESWNEDSDGNRYWNRSGDSYRSYYGD